MKSLLEEQTRCHSSFSGGIICGPHRGQSFAVQFGDHFWSGDHLRTGIIGCTKYSAVQYHIKHMKTSVLLFHVGHLRLRAIVFFAEAFTLHQENIDWEIS